MDWKSLKYEKKIVISKLVAEYNLFSTEVFPYTHCKARVWQEADGSYLALSNIEIRDQMNNTTDGTSEYGNTEAEALDKLIRNLLELIADYEEKWGRALTDADYDYVEAEDF